MTSLSRMKRSSLLIYISSNLILAICLNGMGRVYIRM